MFPLTVVTEDIHTMPCILDVMVPEEKERSLIAPIFKSWLDVPESPYVAATYSSYILKDYYLGKQPSVWAYQ